MRIFLTGLALSQLLLFSVWGTAKALDTWTTDEAFKARVASRCAGEAGWDEGARLCACTVRQRLLNGWTEGRVLSHYYAPDSFGDPFLTPVEDGLKGVGCPADAYYLFSTADTKHLKLSLSCATEKSIKPGEPTKIVYAFPRTTLKRLNCKEK